MELTKLKKVANTGEIDPNDFPKYADGIQPIPFNALDAMKNLHQSLGYYDEPKIPADFKPQIKLPQQPIANGKPAIATEQIGGIVPAAIGFGTDVYGATKYDKGQAELLSEGNRSQQSVDGIGYEAYGGVNQSQFNKDVSSKKTANTLKTMGSGAALGAALGSVIPGLGTVFGGIAGGLIGSLPIRIKEALIKPRSNVMLCETMIASLKKSMMRSAHSSNFGALLTIAWVMCVLSWTF